MVAAPFAAAVLVGTEIEGADGDRQPLECLEHAQVLLQLFLFVGDIVAIHEQEFGAVQADAVGAGAPRRQYVFA